jgi:hypothetical protein
MRTRSTSSATGVRLLFVGSLTGATALRRARLETDTALGYAEKGNDDFEVLGAATILRARWDCWQLQGGGATKRTSLSSKLFFESAGDGCLLPWL